MLQFPFVKVSRVRILYVTDSRHGHRAWQDPSARHRVYHYADAMAASGFDSRVVHIDDVNSALLVNTDHVIFHRPKMTERFKRAYDSCVQSAAVVHADYDDLIFDASVAEHSPLYLNGNTPLSRVVEYFGRNYQAAMLFDNILVSTRYLEDWFAKLNSGARVSVLPNVLPRLFEVPASVRTSSDYFTIGYFPGSNSHGHDVKMIKDAMTGILNRFRNSRFVVAGRLNKTELGLDHPRIEFLPYMDYSKYLSLLSAVDLSIAPLEKNLFNEAKSAVKLIESAAAGTPILVSANQDMIDHSNTLSTIVESANDWEPALDCAINNRRAISHGEATEHAVQYSVQNRLTILQSHLLCAA